MSSWNPPSGARSARFTPATRIAFLGDESPVPGQQDNRGFAVGLSFGERVEFVSAFYVRRTVSDSRLTLQIGGVE